VANQSIQFLPTTTTTKRWNYAPCQSDLRYNHQVKQNDHARRAMNIYRRDLVQHISWPIPLLQAGKAVEIYRRPAPFEENLRVAGKFVDQQAQRMAEGRAQVSQGAIFA